MMQPSRSPLLAAILAILVAASPVAAQLNVPGTQVRLPPVGDVVGDIAAPLDETLETLDQTTRRTAQRLLRQRDRVLSGLLRQNRESIELDANGDLARRGELLAMDINEPIRFRLIEAGFTVIERDMIEGLDLSVYRLAVPEGMALADALKLAVELAPDAEISADHLHFQAIAHTAPASAVVPSAVQASGSIGIEVGMIDGAPGASVSVVGSRGFATGAPRASDHGTAVASLLRSAGVARIRAADVYGSDPAGGNARAIANALGWLTASGSKVISISLVGPKNALVSRAIAAAQRKGAVIVAAVGNDGPAAPPAYPASYPGVIAITGVDRRGKLLIEAGRALHLDYAAPGAGVYALNAKGKSGSWRGTSFATPLAAARVAATIGMGGNWRARLDNEARDLGKRGPDNVYGRGLVCGGCGKK